jgi:hypothetical protein
MTELDINQDVQYTTMPKLNVNLSPYGTLLTYDPWTTLNHIITLFSSHMQGESIQMIYG